MDRPRIDRHGPSPTDASAPWASDFRLTPGWFYRALVIVLAFWVLHSFLEAMLAACVTAVASWPLYTRFANRMPGRLRRGATPLIFTCLMIVFVLAPMVFAFGALLSEAHTLILQIAAADERGIGLSQWLERVPLVGGWIAARWQSELAHPGALMLWAQRTDPALLLGWVRSLGRFTAHHAIIIGFTILLLFFLYREGKVLAQGCRRVLRQRLGAGVERYVGLGTRAVRASVNSMLVVGLFDGLATGVAFALGGVPHPAVWGAITGALALVPFLGYVAVVALALKLAIEGAAAAAFISLALGGAALLAGDKVLRPVVARGGVSLPFVWVLMGCLGGFEVLGLVGLIVGPVVLTLVRELWEQRVRDAAPAGINDPVAAAEEARNDASSGAEANP
jgi:predicted PurR-regulated permease PerM